MRKFKSVILLSVIFQMAILIPGCIAQSAVLQAGIAKVDITPTENLYMGGYDESCRTGKSDGVDGKIYVRALVFDDKINKVVFIEADIVSLQPGDYTPLRKLISTETGIPVENIMLGCVHNHAAPFLMRKTKTLIGRSN